MKFKLNLPTEHYTSGHGVAQLFADAGAALAKNPGDIIAVVKNGIVEFVDKGFEAKFKTLSKHGSFGFSTLSAPVRKPGYLYFDHESPEYIINNSLTESSTESFTETNLVTESEIITEQESEDSRVLRVIQEAIEDVSHRVVANDITFEKDTEYKLFDYSDVLEDADIYRNKDSIFREDTKEVVGRFDGTRGVIKISDEDLVERINRSLQTPIATDIGVSRMSQRAGVYFDFINPEHAVLKLHEVESEDESGETFEYSHFFDDMPEVEIKQRVQQVQESDKESKEPKEPKESVLKDIIKDSLKNIKGTDIIEIQKALGKLADKEINESIISAKSETSSNMSLYLAAAKYY